MKTREQCQAFIDGSQSIEPNIKLWLLNNNWNDGQPCIAMELPQIPDGSVGMRFLIWPSDLDLAYLRERKEFTIEFYEKYPMLTGGELLDAFSKELATFNLIHHPVHRAKGVVVWLSHDTAFSDADRDKLQKYHRTEATIDTMRNVLKDCDLVLVNRVINPEQYPQEYYKGIKAEDWVLDHPLAY